MENIKNIIETLTASKRLVIVGDYTIENGEVNIIGNVKLRGLDHIPFKFGTVDGDFDCSFCGLRSFNNAPHTVTKNVKAQSNKLFDLKHCPQNIGEDLILNGNRFLKNPQGCPEIINGSLDMYNCSLDTLQGIARKVKKDLMLGHNGLGNLGHFPDEVGGNVDVTNNAIITINNIIDKVAGDINSDGNPCNAADGIEENRLW